jgi:hypothetical protein
MPFARRWARSTPGGKGKRFQRLPIKVTVKAPNYGARAGQTIAGNLRRGSSGQFESGGGAARAPKPGKRKPKTETEREAERQQRASERQAEREQTRIAQRDQVLADLGIDPGASEALVMLANGEQPEPSAIARMGAVEAGLVEQAADGSYRMTPAGRQLLNAAERGDKGAAGDVISRARDRRAAQAEKPPTAAGGGGGKKKPEKPPKLPPRQTSQGVKPVGGGGPRQQQPDKPAAPTIDPALADLVQRLSAGEALTDDEQQTLIRNGLARLVKGEMVLTMAGQRATRGKSFHVYKDARGRLRWVAYSSNAYRDRDEEIVSTKALQDDCARADADAAYGPLRWWHVPGWELGDCDFNAMHGRVLVESGTFKSDAIGQAVARAAPSLQLSIGFTHAPDEPDRHGVFHHIRRFERSLVPSGRAANPFTKLSVVKESGMDTEKEAALKTALGDEAATQVLAGAEAVQKDADDRQTAYKSDDPWAAVLTTLKAAVATMIAPPVVEPEPAPVAEKAVTDIPEADAKADVEMIDEPVVEAVAEDPGEMTYDEFVGEIRRVVREEIGAELKAQLAPLAGMLDIEKKVSGAVQSLMQPYQAQKDDEAAALKALIEEHQLSLKDAQSRLVALEGDQPSAWKAPWGGYRATEDDATTTTKEQAEALGLPALDDDAEWTKLRNGLFGAAPTNGVTN